MQLALAISVSLHAAVLGVRFVDPEDFNRVFQDTPLEVILVNSKTTERAGLMWQIGHWHRGMNQLEDAKR